MLSLGTTAGGVGEIEDGGGQRAAERVEEQVEARVNEAADIGAGIDPGNQKLDRLVNRPDTEAAEQSEDRACSGSILRDHVAEHVPTCGRSEARMRARPDRSAAGPE